MLEEYINLRKNDLSELKKKQESNESRHKNWDPVKEIRKFRDESADELLKRWEVN
jgi:hypothetical protein